MRLIDKAQGYPKRTSPSGQHSDTARDGAGATQDAGADTSGTSTSTSTSSNGGGGAAVSSGVGGSAMDAVAGSKPAGTSDAEWARYLDAVRQAKKQSRSVNQVSLPLVVGAVEFICSHVRRRSAKHRVAFSLVSSRCITLAFLL
jgi:hypothetical protein